MSEVYIDLKSPSVLRVLRDVPTMQRWEILRRAQRPFTVAELAQSARISPDDAQRSLDRLAEAGLVTKKPATARRQKITYRAAMERLFLSWDRSDPEAAAAWRVLGESMRDYSRRVQDETTARPGSEQFSPSNFIGWSSVLLLEEDASRVRQAFRSAYALLAEADQRARSHSGTETAHPFHVAFTLMRMWELDLPMAEFFVIEKTNCEIDQRIVRSTAGRILSPREFQIAKLLESGKSRPAIAKELGLTANTVASLSKIIYRKLDVRSRAALSARMKLG
ncbi:MAG: Bacterial regulatory protein luxR family [Planctomycetota bacterium]|jgi:DNA-binding CsgD family transcriptional regulator